MVATLTEQLPPFPVDELVNRIKYFTYSPLEEKSTSVARMKWNPGNEGYQIPDCASLHQCIKHTTSDMKSTLDKSTHSAQHPMYIVSHDSEIGA